METDRDLKRSVQALKERLNQKVKDLALPLRAASYRGEGLRFSLSGFVSAASPGIVNSILPSLEIDLPMPRP
jgi:hypothetical protein